MTKFVDNSVTAYSTCRWRITATDTHGNSSSAETGDLQMYPILVYGDIVSVDKSYNGTNNDRSVVLLVVNNHYNKSDARYYIDIQSTGVVVSSGVVQEGADVTVVADVPPGHHTLRLWVGNNPAYDGYKLVDMFTGTFAASAGNTAPTVSIYAANIDTQNPLQVDIGYSLQDAEDSSVEVDVDFGDNDTATWQSLATGTNHGTGHIYSQPGTYTITVTATDSGGLTGSDSVVVTVGGLPVGTLVHTQAEYDSAIASAGPGDAITLANGTYSDFVFSTTKSGAAGNPILIRAESVGGVVLNGAVEARFDGDYIRFHGFKFSGTMGDSGEEAIVGCYGDSILVERLEFDQFLMDSALDPANNRITFIHCRTNTEVRYCRFDGKNNLGAHVYVHGSDSHDMGCYIHHNYFSRDAFSGNGGESLQFGPGVATVPSNNNEAAYNIFEDADGENEVVSVKGSNNHIHHNVMKDSSGAFTLRYVCDDNVVEYNVVIASHGVRLFGKRNIIRYNHFESCTHYRGAINVGMGDGATYDAPVDTVLQNNTFIDADNGIGLKDVSSHTVPSTNTAINDNYIHVITNAVSKDPTTNTHIASGNIIDGSYNTSHFPSGFTQQSLSYTSNGDAQHPMNLPDNTYGKGAGITEWPVKRNQVGPLA